MNSLIQLIAAIAGAVAKAWFEARLHFEQEHYEELHEILKADSNNDILERVRERVRARREADSNTAKQPDVAGK